MSTPRSQLVDNEQPLHYHLVSRCVRRSWLCGVDPQTGKDYGHRKNWLVQRMYHLAKCFAVAIDAYAIMSNHFHLVAYFDPKECYRWSDETVADRWLQAFPPRSMMASNADQQAIHELHKERLLQSPARLKHARETLGSLSMFMKHLKQPIAYQANKEDGCRGHFFEGRFYSAALLDERAVIAAMAYVDLNPIRARIAKDIAEYKAASAHRRTQVANNTPERLAEAVKPLVSGLTTPRPALSVSLGDYLGILEQCKNDYRSPTNTDRQSRWFQSVASIKKRQRAFGETTALAMWRTDRGWSVPGSALPAA